MKKILMINVMTLMMVSFLAAAQPKGLHNSWDVLLKKHVLSGKVNYKGFIADKAELDAYLHKLDKAGISAYSQKEKLAFWINAYNAYTVKLIVDNYPLMSIRDLSKPWKKKFCKVAGKTVSLDHIEHKILRKEFFEPRIHFAIVCASIGCPDLQPFAYRADQIEAQLGTVARTFFISVTTRRPGQVSLSNMRKERTWDSLNTLKPSVLNTWNTTGTSTTTQNVDPIIAARASSFNCLK